jgi:hypothetical protein
MIGNMWISDTGKVRAIVGALSDEYSKRIIAATITTAKSPEQIRAEQGIPLSTCYRRIHDLLVLSLIHVDRIDLSNGKKSVLYKSAYKNILIKFESNELVVDLVPNSGNEGPLVASSNAAAGGTAVPPGGITGDCDLCQTQGTLCKVFVTGDSKSYLSICQKCEKKMYERNTIKAIQATTAERMAQRVLNKITK